MVDPDNRRPVDYRTRTTLLGQILTSLEGNRHTAMLDMLDKWRDGRIKLAVIATLLAYRRDRPKLFAQGGYEPLAASGGRANQICAFARRDGEDALVVVAARFPAGCEGERDWNGTEVEWPQAGDNVPWRDLFTARIFERQSETVDVCAVLPDLPMAVLVPDNGVRG